MANYIKVTKTNYLFPQRKPIINEANSSAYDVYSPTKKSMRPTNLSPLVSNQRNYEHIKMNIFWEEDPCDLSKSDKKHVNISANVICNR